LTEHDHQEQERERESDGVCELSGVSAREGNRNDCPLLLAREHEEKELQLQQEQAVREWTKQQELNKHKWSNCEAQKKQ
jgi:hypothetical protein